MKKQDMKALAHVFSRVILILFSILFAQNSYCQWRFNDQAIIVVDNQKKINSAANDFGFIAINGESYFVSDRKDKMFDVYQIDHDTAILVKNYSSEYHEGPIAKYKDGFLFSRSIKVRFDGKKRDGIVLHQQDKASGTPIAILAQFDLMQPTAYNDKLICAHIISKSDVNLAMVDIANQRIDPSPFDSINTLGLELSPYFVNEKLITYSANRRGGSGDLDVYFSYLHESGKWSAPMRLDAGLNTRSDDFSFTSNSNFTQGYLASNRFGGLGGDDVYRWNSDQPILFYQQPIIYKDLAFSIEDQLSGSLIDNSKISFTQVSSEKEKSVLKMLGINQFVISDTAALFSKYPFLNSSTKTNLESDKGRVTSKVEVQSDLFLIITAPNYETKLFYLTYDQWSTLSDISIPLTPVTNANTSEEALITAKEVQFKKYIIRNIYLKNNRLIVPKAATAELEQIIKQCNASKQTLSIRAHTSAKGNNVNNLERSKSLASALSKWLIYKGLNQKEISATGEGSIQLLNNCYEGASCSDSQHAENERVEIIIEE